MTVGQSPACSFSVSDGREVLFLSPFPAVLGAIHVQVTDRPSPDAPSLTQANNCANGLLRVNGACAHYVIVSKFQWKPFWLATQRDPQNDWTATQNRVNYDVFAQAPLAIYGIVSELNRIKMKACE